MGVSVKETNLFIFICMPRELNVKAEQNIFHVDCLIPGADWLYKPWRAEIFWQGLKPKSIKEIITPTALDILNQVGSSSRHS